MAHAFYTAAGINVPLGDLFSHHAKGICKATWNNSKYVRVHDYAEHNFRGPRAFYFCDVPEGTRMDIGSDGVGTKPVITTAARAHRNAGYDLIAMKATDRTRWGMLPLLCVNVLDVSTLGKDQDDPAFKLFLELIEGMKDAADEIGVVLYAGETAELGPLVGSEDPDAITKFNWSGACFGLARDDLLITGEHMRPGDIVIALQEETPRSNGVSGMRKAFATQFGPRWWEHPDAQQWIAQAARGSKLYDKFLCTMNGWFNGRFEPEIPMQCISHISGGGIPSKFFEDILVPLGLSADLDDLFDPPPVMRNCADWYIRNGRPVPDDECYGMWHGGQGALVAVRPQHASHFVLASNHAGIPAKPCGMITKRDVPRLTIASKFRGGTLEYFAK